MFNWSVIKEAGRKAVVYLMLFVMSFNTVACNMETDTKVPASLTVSPEPGLHEYPFDGTGGVSGQVQTISGSYVAMDGSTSMSVKFEFPEGITVQSNEGNGFASFIFDAPGYYIIKAHAMYNGKAAITQEIHYSITSTLTALGLKTNKDDASIGTTLRMTKGETLTLIPVYTPASSGTLGVEWEIDESNGVISTQEVENQSSIPPYQVEKQLKVTALAEGSTTIKATSVDNSEISKEITVVVSATMTDQSTNPTYITISNPEKTEVELGETVTLSATVYDGYNNPASGQTVEFVVEDEGVFEILEKTTNSVTLEAVGGGDSRIFAYLLDKDGSRVPGIDSYTTLSTIGAIEKLSITPYFGILLGGGDEVVNVEYYPANTFEKGFEVSIQNPKIVALVEQSDETFTLRPLSKGQTQITLTSTSDAGIKASATIVVDEELSNVERITKVAFDESVLNFTSMASQTIKAHTYVRNLQGVVETDDSLGLKFTNKNTEIISIHQEESTPNTLTITPVRPTKENEKAIVEVRSTENDNFYDELTVYVEGDLVRLVPATSSVDLLMGTDGGYDIVPYPENAVFALDSESDKDGKAVVSIDVSNTDSIKNARLEREGNLQHGPRLEIDS